MLRDSSGDGGYHDVVGWLERADERNQRRAEHDNERAITWDRRTKPRWARLLTGVARAWRWVFLAYSLLAVAGGVIGHHLSQFLLGLVLLVLASLRFAAPRG
jgi:hypothetical protein